MANGPKVNPSQFASKWSQNSQAAGEYIKQGVERVTEAPGKKAAAQVAKMRQNLVASLDNGKWAARVGAVSVEQWKEKMINKGLARHAQGVQEAEGKMEAFGARLLPHIASGQMKIEKMPDLTLQDSKNRAVAWIDHMSKMPR